MYGLLKFIKFTKLEVTFDYVDLQKETRKKNFFLIAKLSLHYQQKYL